MPMLLPVPEASLLGDVTSTNVSSSRLLMSPAVSLGGAF